MGEEKLSFGEFLRLNFQTTKSFKRIPFLLEYSILEIGNGTLFRKLGIKN